MKLAGQGGSNMRLVIFDVDGTIVDSAAHIVDTAQYVFRQNELAVPTDADVRGIIGLNLEIAMLKLCPSVGEVEAERLAQDYRDHFNNKIENGLIDEQLYDGAIAAIETLAGQDETFLGIATGKRLKGVERLFKDWGIWSPFPHTANARQQPIKATSRYDPNSNV